MNEVYKETHFYDVKGDRLKIGAHKSGGYGDMADYIVLLQSIKEKHPDILESIKIEKELTKENTIKLKSFFDDFLSKFKN